MQLYHSSWAAADKKLIWLSSVENLSTQVSLAGLSVEAQTGVSKGQASVQDSSGAAQNHAKPPSASTSGTKHKNKKANKNASMMDFD